MKNVIFNKWFAFRFGVLTSMIWALSAYPREKSNLDWWAAGIISLVVCIVLFIWLTAVRSRNYMEWSKPYDLNEPFFPMNKYPLRYLIVFSFSSISGGAISFFLDLIHQGGNKAFGGTFLILGLEYG